MSNAETIEFEADFVLEDITEPGMWAVIFHNDDVTPMDFVVQVLYEIFHKNARTATEIMMHIHNNGNSVVGVYTHEIAEEKASHTVSLARQQGYPLCVTIEPED